MENISFVKVILLAFGIFILMGILSVAFGIISIPFFLANTVIDSAKGVVTKTADPNNVIYNYEYFKQACQDIKAQDGIIVNAETALQTFETSAGARSTWDYNDKNTDAQLSENVTGAKNTQQQMIAEYNARAKMMNRKIFDTESCSTLVTP